MSLRPPPAFNPRPRRLSTPTDAFQLHPDVRSYGTTRSYIPVDLCAKHGVSTEDVYRGNSTEALRNAVHEVASAAMAHLNTARGMRERIAAKCSRRVLSISHWFPYDRVRAVNADP